MILKRVKMYLEHVLCILQEIGMIFKYVLLRSVVNDDYKKKG